MAQTVEMSAVHTKEGIMVTITEYDEKWMTADDAGVDFNGDLNSREGIDLITTWLREPEKPNF
ncbi:MAG: hypothetical protein IPI28_15905 [Candidatus Omnitrophica bacterium]|nr:hypothetical protein [Candidatus Omnitrophota bacterium]